MSSRLLFAAVVLSPLACAQFVSFGVVGGASVTGDFLTSYQPIPGAPGILSGPYSSPERYIVGGMLEFRLPRNWSVEVDGLYHPLRFDVATLYPNGTLALGSPSPVITYEFPVLAKYRFHWGAWRPFLEAGPSFRTAGNLNGTSPSPYGLAAGVGAEVALGRFRIAPEVRYIRWANDGASGSAATRPDQIELLTSFSTGGVTEGERALARHISLGVVTGVTLTPDFRALQVSYQGFFTTTSGVQAINETYSDSSGPPSFLVGPMVEASIGRGLFLEADAIHRPMPYHDQYEYNGSGGSFTRTPDTWNFPVLAKYKFSARAWKPFVELGPSFRFTHSLTETVGLSASPFGVTAGAGIETHYRWLKIAPAIRYTYWGPNSRSYLEPAPYQNQLELLGGFFF